MAAEDQIDAELKKAEHCRNEGNEGMARVCSRRAAGLALRHYLVKIGQNHPHLNNFEIMANEDIRKLLPEETSGLLDHLILRVDAQHNIPAHIDLIADAGKVIQILRDSE
jgi:hypothetical protein